MRSISTRMCLLAATCAWAGQPAEAACGQLMCVPHACRRPYSWPPMLGRHEHASVATAMRQRSVVAVAQHSVGAACLSCGTPRDALARAELCGSPNLGTRTLPIWGPTERARPERDPPASATRLGRPAGPSPRLGWDRSARRRGRGEGGDGWMVVVITMVVRLLETRLASGEERSRARDDHFPNANHCTRIGASRRSFRINQPSCDIGVP